MAILRLNYACDLRYGVLVDIATKVWNGQPIDVSRAISIPSGKGDANAMTLCAFSFAQDPAARAQYRRARCVVATRSRTNVRATAVSRQVHIVAPNRDCVAQQRSLQLHPMGSAQCFIR